jgi:DNA modification methylase
MMCRYDVHEGDCLQIMPTLEAESVDAVVCDPPYGLEFMGKDWDHGVPGEHFWSEALRVAKPGAHLLAFGGTRTHHRLACAIEDAGWEVRDCLMWLYGQGFPKSKDVAKAIDESHGNPTAEPYTPTHPEAIRWHGWGTALKPAWEPIILARKPLSGTVAENVTEYGCGGINVNGCRVGTTVETWPESRSYHAQRGPKPREAHGSGDGITMKTGSAPPGRWPANLILDSEAAERLDGEAGDASYNKAGLKADGQSGGWPGGERSVFGYGDSGGPSRFFYTAKAGSSDRNSHAPIGAKTGHAEPNRHPTVKPTDLMRWLVRLVTPPGGTVFDPFTGSGSTGVACVAEGVGFVGIELDPDHAETARARIAAEHPVLFSEIGGQR